MRKIFTTLLLVFSLSLCKAQWVTIPDANFVAVLQNYFPSCMNGNQMDTTCNNIVNAASLNFNLSGIYDLTGIQYFDNLEELFCEENSLTTLPILPDNLSILYCSNNPITSLSALPANLTELYCNGTQLTSLPNIPTNLTIMQCYYNQLTFLPPLPLTLVQLDCNHNQLDSLPSLPNSLTSINCDNNQLTSFSNLPGSLIELSCESNQLVSLPLLPSGLLTLSCGGNQLTSLPVLPAGLTGLWCAMNQLTSLPFLVSTSLTSLNCGMNLLTSLPPLPTNLQSLNCNDNQLLLLPSLPQNLTALICFNNQLSVLPVLPASLGSLFCSANQLTSIPTLPQSLFCFQIQDNPIVCMPILHSYIGPLSFFNVSQTNISCFPNIIQHNGFIPAIDTMPICNQFNSGGCYYCTIDTGELVENICSGSFYNFNGMNIYSQGIYLDTILGGSCDSIVRLNLSVQMIDTSISWNGNSLVTLSSGNIQWFDCNTQQIISGATQNVFVAPTTGSYAAIITEGNCVDTTICKNVVTGINQAATNTNQFSVFPNPVTHELTIQLNSSSNNCKIEITNVLGVKVVGFGFGVSSSSITFNLKSFSSGVYFVRVSNEQWSDARKIIKQ